MKTKKNHKCPRRKRCIVAVLILGVVASFCIFLFAPGPRHLDADATERYIVGQLSSNAVPDRFSPVLLYRMSNSLAYFSGSGSYFVGKKGEQVVTAGHLFSTNSGFGDTAFGLRFLRPFNTDITMELVSVFPADSTFLKMDVAVAKVKGVTSSPANLTNYSTLGRSVSHVGPLTSVKLDSGRTIRSLRSLVTGKSYDIVGVATNAPGIFRGIGVCLNYDAIPGESGTGFIDEEGALYVLSMVEDKTQPQWKDVKRGIAKVYKGKIVGVATVNGPLKISD